MAGTAGDARGGPRRGQRGVRDPRRRPSGRRRATVASARDAALEAHRCSRRTGSRRLPAPGVFSTSPAGQSTTEGVRDGSWTSSRPTDGSSSERNRRGALRSHYRPPPAGARRRFAAPVGALGQHREREHARLPPAGRRLPGRPRRRRRRGRRRRRALHVRAHRRPNGGARARRRQHRRHRHRDGLAGPELARSTRRSSPIQRSRFRELETVIKGA